MRYSDLPPKGQSTAESPEFLPLPLDQLSLDAVMEIQLFIKVEDRFIKYREPGIPFDEEVKVRLKENGHSHIYYRSQDGSLLSSYLEKNLLQLLNDPHQSDTLKAGALYTTSVHLVRELIKDPTSPQAVKTCQNIVAAEVEFMLTTPQALGLIISLASRDYYTYTHSVNVMCYSTALAQKLDYPPGDPLRELAQSAFFHDTGKSFIDWNITNKSGPLNDSEFAIMKLHPEFGFTALSGTGEVPDYTLYGVRHHHEKLNGRGYPLGLKAPRIDLGVRIITLVDMYDALTTRRVYRDAYTGYDALQSIKGLVGEEIDEKVYEGFIKLLGETVVPEKSITEIP